MRLQTLAKTISWLSLAWIIALAFKLTLMVGLHIGEIILFGTSILHLWYSVKGRYGVVYKYAIAELFLAVLVLAFFLYPIPGSDRFVHGTPPLPFDKAIWVWIIGTCALGVPIWICASASKTTSP